MKLKILRLDDNGVQTLGQGLVYEDHLKLFEFNTLELPWKDNEKYISCIPAGEYEVLRHVSEKYSECFWVQNVPGRSEILIHKGNFYTDILGCILPGVAFTDINNDGYLDVTSSTKTVRALINLLPERFTLNIYG